MSLVFDITEKKRPRIMTIKSGEEIKKIKYYIDVNIDKLQELASAQKRLEEHKEKAIVNGELKALTYTLLSAFKIEEDNIAWIMNNLSFIYIAEVCRGLMNEHNKDSKESLAEQDKKKD